MNNNSKIFCFGFGQVAKYFIKSLILKKKKFDLVTTSRSKTKKKKFFNKKYLSLRFQDGNYDKKIIFHLRKSDYIIVSIPPVKNQDLVLKNFEFELKSSKFNNLLYLSSTSVYGNHNGKWVNEKSSLKPSTKFGKERMLCERKWRKFQKNTNLPINIFRLSGIYSKEFNVIKRLKKGLRTYIKKNNQYFSRIRVEDIATAIDKIFSKKQIKGKIFNVSDNKPASNEEIVKYGSRILNIKNLRSISEKDLKSNLAKSFYKESKKVNNKKLLKVLKLKLKYPSYKEGLRDFIN
tara:strand:+ start:2988 stop:3860 length:873 start_codon:yes stop_codon:yes gene_type:complete